MRHFPGSHDWGARYTRWSIAVTWLSVVTLPVIGCDALSSDEWPVDEQGQYSQTVGGETQTTAPGPEPDTLTETHDAASRRSPGVSDQETVEPEDHVTTTTSSPSETAATPQPREPAAVAGAWAPSDVPWTVSDVQLWLIWAVIGLSIATIVAVATSFYLYYWRRVLLAQPSAVVPEAWAKYLHQVGRRLSDLDTSMSRTRQELVQSSSASSKQIADMVETLMTLQNALDARDAEIRRLKNGYDAQVFRQFLFRFIRVQQALHDITAQADGDRQQLGMLKALMEDALDECGVEAFEPTLGKDWRREKGVADKPQNTKTDDPGIVDQIAEVLEPGYRLMSGEEPDVIRPAKVRIFALDE